MCVSGLARRFPFFFCVCVPYLLSAESFCGIYIYTLTVRECGNVTIVVNTVCRFNFGTLVVSWLCIYARVKQQRCACVKARGANNCELFICYYVVDFLSFLHCQRVFNTADNSVKAKWILFNVFCCLSLVISVIIIVVALKIIDCSPWSKLTVISLCLKFFVVFISFGYLKQSFFPPGMYLSVKISIQ